jgi:ATP-dependent DNA ligase
VHQDGIAALHRSAHKCGDDGLELWPFDLMQLDSYDLRRVALEDRKRRLGHLIERAGGTAARRVRQARARGRRHQAQERHLPVGRSTSWVKVKSPAWRETNRTLGELSAKSENTPDDWKSAGVG